MVKIKINKDPNIAIDEINHKIDELEKFISLHEQKKTVLDVFGNWRIDVKRELDGTFSEQIISKDFLIETKVLLNKFSDYENVNKIGDVLYKGKGYLENLIIDIESGKYSRKDNNDPIEKTTAVIIIRRILKNFYKHIEAMYQDGVHGNGKIKKEDLNRIKIQNEYDVQRVLYSLIRPIFPETRLEVVDDAGYNSMRYDIVLEEYKIVIEVKCTRANLTERKLTEELGADSFHYKTDNLFLFIFDKAKIIKNPDVFSKAFKREKIDYDKDLETIVIQEVNF